MLRSTRALQILKPLFQYSLQKQFPRIVSFSRVSFRSLFSTSSVGKNTISKGRKGARNLEKYNIEAQCPDLIKFWHPTKNGDLRPSDVSIRSIEKIWWKCTRGPDHEWYASPRTMFNPETKEISKCPFCDNRMVSITNSLATLYPEIAAQWHPTLNGDITPSTILPTSSYSAWWKCDKGDDHVWKRVVSHRCFPRSSIEDKCPFCLKVDSKSQSLASCRPDLAKEWDYERNGSLTPDMVSKSSAKKVWWVCEKGHHFQCTVYNRGSTHNTGCPICSCHKVTDETRLINHHHLLDFLDPVNNKDIDITNLSILSRKQLQWRCPESEFDESKKHHVWRCSIHDMEFVYNEECPFCSNTIKLGENMANWNDFQLSSNVSTYYRPRQEKKRKKKEVIIEKGRKRRVTVRDIDSIIESLNKM